MTNAKIVAFPGSSVIAPVVAPTPAPVATSEFFTVEKHKISGPYGDIANKKGIFVDGQCINIVSNSYEVHQPNEIYRTFEDVAARTGLEIRRTLSNPKNGGLLISAKYADCKILDESHDINLTFYTSHCGKYKTFLTLDLLRMLCLNQVPCLYRNKERHIFAEKHYKNALDIELIGHALEEIPASIAAYNEKASLLIDKKFSFDDFVEFYKGHYNLKEEQKQYDSKVAKLRSIYFNATGQREISGENGYKAFQAITFANTHEGRNTAMKEENILTKNSADSLRVLDKLLAA